MLSMASADSARDQSILRSIYAIVLLVGIGYGLSTAVVSLFLRRLGFPEHHVGYLGSAFATGIVAGSLVAGKLIERLSAKRTLLLGLFGYALAVSVFPLGRAPMFFALSRAIDGAFSVLVWVSVETELLRRASSKNKARVMSLYAISMALGYVVGPAIARGLMALSLPLGAVFVSAGLLAVFAFALSNFTHYGRLAWSTASASITTRVFHLEADSHFLFRYVCVRVLSDFGGDLTAALPDR
jgi:MFS family permease